jgi:hypothetical protein
MLTISSTFAVVGISQTEFSQVWKSVDHLPEIRRCGMTTVITIILALIVCIL